MVIFINELATYTFIKYESNDSPKKTVGFLLKKYSLHALNQNGLYDAYWRGYKIHVPEIIL